MPIFKNLRAKSREFRPQNRTISVPTVRATFNLRAQNQSESFRRHSTPPCALRHASAAAARVFCAKTAPKFIETFAISTENHEFRPPNLRQKSPRSSGKAPHLVQRALYDRSHLLCVLHVRWWLTSCRFSKICAQNRAKFDRKIAEFRCRTCTQRSIDARRTIPRDS